MKKQRKSFSLILLMTIIVINTASFSAYAEPDILDLMARYWRVMCLLSLLTVGQWFPCGSFLKR